MGEWDNYREGFAIVGRDLHSERERVVDVLHKLRLVGCVHWRKTLWGAGGWGQGRIPRENRGLLSTLQEFDHHFCLKWILKL